MSNPYFVTNQAGAGQIGFHHHSIGSAGGRSGLFRCSQQPLADFLGNAFPTFGQHLLNQIGRRKLESAVSASGKGSPSANNESNQPRGKPSIPSIRLATSSPRFFAVLSERIWLKCAEPSPALRAGPFPLAANQLDQVVLANFVDIHAAKNASV